MPIGIAGDVISGVAVDYAGMDVNAKFDEFGLNSGWPNYFTLWPAGRPDPFYASLLSSI